MNEFVLKLEPVDRLLFTGKKLDEEAMTMQLRIRNPTKDRYTYKLKCTSNEMFQIRSPVGFVEASKDVQISVSFFDIYLLID